MKMQNNVIIAALAAAALGLTACGGDTTDAPAPADTTAAAPADQQTTPGEESTDDATTEAPGAEESPAEESPAEETSVAEEPPAEAPADFPFEEGPVDVGEFVDRYVAAQQSITTAKSVQTSTAEMSTPHVTYLDNTDPSNPRAYSIIEGDDMKIETLAEGTTVYTRTDDGEWETQELPEDLPGSGSTLDPELMKKVFTSVELADKDERRFNVVMDLGAAMGGEPAAEGVPTTMWLDDQFRLIKQEVTVGGVVSTTEYSEFGEPVEIPEVS